MRLLSYQTNQKKYPRLKLKKKKVCYELRAQKIYFYSYDDIFRCNITSSMPINLISKANVNMLRTQWENNLVNWSWLQFYVLNIAADNLHNAPIA